MSREPLRTSRPARSKLWIACGNVSGSREALRGGLFLADVNGGDEPCYGVDSENNVQPTQDIDPTPGWLVAATAFEVDGTRRRLLDHRGGVVATFEPGTIPAEYRGVYAPPTASPEERATLDAVPPALPAGARPATPDELGGVWVLADRPRTNGRGAYVEFQPDFYEASDGCNETGGRWALSGRVLLRTSGPSTLVGCENIDVLGTAVVVGIADGRLVLIDAGGKEIRRIVRGVK